MYAEGGINREDATVHEKDGDFDGGDDPEIEDGTREGELEVLGMGSRVEAGGRIRKDRLADFLLGGWVCIDALTAVS